MASYCPDIQREITMNALHASIVTVGLFALTFLSPGPNLLVVVQASLSRGRAAGIAAGAGVATGDGLYAALGLFGMSAMITGGGTLFHLIKILGGLYLIWFGVRLFINRAPAALSAGVTTSARTLGGCFARGLVTDLANPQTVLFFASIFALTLRADTPVWAKALSWTGIVATSVLWRSLLSIALSHDRVRRVYERAQVPVERLVGVALGAFGARLFIQGLEERSAG
jgi:amino acid exporter